MEDLRVETRCCIGGDELGRRFRHRHHFRRRVGKSLVVFTGEGVVRRRYRFWGGQEKELDFVTVVRGWALAVGLPSPGVELSC